MNTNPFRIFPRGVATIFGLFFATTLLFAHSSRDALDWAGTYVGNMPCVGGCPDCTVAVTLSQDGKFEMRCAAEPKCCDTEPLVGDFQWDDAGQRVSLDVGEVQVPSHFFVGEEFLETVDADGNRDEGSILRKDTEARSDASA